MMTTLALCLHLATMPAHPVRACRVVSDVTTFVAADGKTGNILVLSEEDEHALQIANAANPQPLVLSYNRTTNLLVATKAPAPWLATWLADLSSVVALAINCRAYEARIARERANPSRVVDLRELHDEGDLLQTERENLRAAQAQYRAFAGVDVPAAALP